MTLPVTGDTYILLRIQHASGPRALGLVGQLTTISIGNKLKIQ